MDLELWLEYGSRRTTFAERPIDPVELPEYPMPPKELDQNEEYWEVKRKHFEDVENRERLQSLRNKLKELSDGNH